MAKNGLMTTGGPYNKVDGSSCILRWKKKSQLVDANQRVSSTLKPEMFKHRYNCVIDMKGKEIYRVNAFKDPITHFIFSKWKHFFAILLIFFFLQMIVSFLSGTLINFDESLIPESEAARLKEGIEFIPTLKYVPFFSTYLVSIGLFFLLRRYFLSIPQSFQILFENKIFRDKKGGTRENVSITYNKSLQEFENAINAKTMYVLAFLLYFLVILFFVIALEPTPKLDIILWSDFNFFPLNWSVIIFTAPLMWFVVGILVWKMYCVVAFMRRLAHDYEFDLNPYNPDGFGGFKPLGQLWVNMAFVIIPVSLTFAFSFAFHRYFELSYPLWRRYVDLAIIIAYTTVIIIFLVYPMKEYYDIVRNEKLELLKGINVKIKRLWKMVKAPLLSDRDEDLVRASWEQLERSRRFVDVVKRIPSWPFTPSEKVGIFLIALTPWILEAIRYFLLSNPP